MLAVVKEAVDSLTRELARGGCMCSVLYDMDDRPRLKILARDRHDREVKLMVGADEEERLAFYVFDPAPAEEAPLPAGNPLLPPRRVRSLQAMMRFARRHLAVAPRCDVA